jgi:HSP20 family protein
MPDSPAPVPNRSSGSFLSTFDQLHNEINRMFDRFAGSSFSGSGFLDTLKRVDLVPSVDVSQREDAYEITAELPGVTEKDIALSVDNGTLTLKGEKKTEKEEKSKDRFVSERSYGAFSRSFSLPDDAEDEKIAAEFKNGVLKIVVPRNKTHKSPNARQIAVKAS